jgi:hypothetical protein
MREPKIAVRPQPLIIEIPPLTEPKGKIWIGNQSRRGSWSDAKFFAVNSDVHGRPDEDGIAEEGVKGTDDEDGMFLPHWPLFPVSNFLSAFLSSVFPSSSFFPPRLLCAGDGTERHTWRGSLGSSAGTGNKACPYPVSSPSTAFRSTVPGSSPSCA